MSTYIKTAVIATGVIASSIAGYYLWRRLRNVPATLAASVAPVADTSALAEVAGVPAVDVVIHLQDTSIATEVVEVHSDTVTAAPVLSEQAADTIYLPIIEGKNIIIYGVETKGATRNHVFTNGAQQVIDTDTAADEAIQIQHLHSGIWRNIMQIQRTVRKGQGSVMNSALPHIRIQTRVATSKYVIVQFTPEDPAVMPGLKTAYVLVEHEDLVCTRQVRDLNRKEWYRQMRAIFAHLIYAVDDNNSITPGLREGMYTSMCNHFVLLGHMEAVRNKTPIVTGV